MNLISQKTGKVKSFKKCKGAHLMKIAIFLLHVSDLCSLSSDLVHTWRESNRQHFTSSGNHVKNQFSKETECVMYMIQ